MFAVVLIALSSINLKYSVDQKYSLHLKNSSQINNLDIEGNTVYATNSIDATNDISPISKDTTYSYVHRLSIEYNGVNSHIIKSILAE
ncbi:TPA: hypothetical protein ACGIK9_002783 [Acinetobacter baumannii]